MSKYEDLLNAARDARMTTDSEKSHNAHDLLFAFVEKAATMHDELVATLETMIFGDPDLDKVKDVIKRARAI